MKVTPGVVLVAIVLAVDTSTLLATLFAEPERDAVRDALAEAGTVLLSSCCHLAASIVAASRLGPAGLNIFDCCPYALAAQSQMPLLAVGGDFKRTDVGLVDLSLGRA